MKKNAKALFLLIVCLWIGGCKSPDEMQTKYPRWPWGDWWNYPAKKAEPAPEPQPAPEIAPAPRERKALSEAELAGHRAEVWKQVSPLRDLSQQPPDEQKKQLRAATEQQAQWYEPMNVPAPRPSDPAWMDTLIWDFMPEKEFVAATQRWRSVALEESLKFPDPATRRGLMQFIRQVTSGEAPKIKPPSPPAAPAAGEPKESP